MQIWNKSVFFSLKYNPNGEICEPSILSFLPLELHLNDSFVFLICLQNIHTQKICSSRKKKKKLKNTNNRISLGFFFFFYRLQVLNSVLNLYLRQNNDRGDFLVILSI